MFMLVFDSTYMVNKDEYYDGRFYLLIVVFMKHPQSA